MPQKPMHGNAAELDSVTGGVLDSAMGSLKDSEPALSALRLKGSWDQWLLVGDRNLGVYWVARAMGVAQAQGLFRLTKSRAAKLARSTGLKLAPGLAALLSWSLPATTSVPRACPPSRSRAAWWSSESSVPAFAP
ncbi:MAG: hypothetical protein NT167_18565 [Verrucomicrobia bacterium]|nr:hypothetical protein [Verrucomicrobiota bacterium]